jgi:hypothetical protein
VPVGLAFIVVGDDGCVRARYPSPAGATEWEVDGDDWAALVNACPALGGLRPEVEALLLDTTRGRHEAWIVPVTDGFRLVAAVRTSWKGLAGGDGVWREIDEFFARLEEATWEASASACRT